MTARTDQLAAACAEESKAALRPAGMPDVDWRTIDPGLATQLERVDCDQGRVFPTGTSHQTPPLGRLLGALDPIRRGLLEAARLRTARMCGDD